MTPIVYLDGALVKREDARVPVDDRGFVFGDGVYEVIRVIDGRPFEAERHYARLEDGLREIRIAGSAIPDTPQTLAIADQLLDRNGLTSGEATIYIQITRGSAPRAHVFPPPATSPTVFLAVNRVLVPHELRDRGAAAVTHPDLRWGRCDIKSINLLPNVLAKQFAAERKALEAILIRDGIVTEGSHTSVFAVHEGTLRTHPLSPAILPGITRAVVLELAGELDLEVNETPLRTDELPRVEELFLAGTTTDVMPVVELDGRPVGDGHPGATTRALYDRLAERMAASAATSRR